MSEKSETKANESVRSNSVSKVETKSGWKNWFASTNDHREIDKKLADVTLDLIDQNGGKVAELTPEKEKKLKWKLWLTILPLVFVVNATLFIDKNAISYSSLTGVFKDMKLTKEDYNNTQTFFYVGYLVGQFPSHYLFQKFPISKYLTAATASWTLLSFCTLASKSYGGLSALRFFLGFAESGITPCLEHTITMFFTIEEQAIVNPIFWISCLGVDVPTGFIAYGLQYTSRWRPWKWYWTFVGIISAIVSTVCFLIYPDNPASSKLFSVEERVHIIERVKKSSRSSIEQKVFKKYQFFETLKDPVSWLFSLAIFFNMLENSTSYQSSIIYTSLGFNNFTTTLLMVIQKGFATVCAIAGSLLLWKFKKQSTLVAIVFTSISWLGALLAMCFPYSNKIGILAGVFLTNADGTAYIIIFSLCTTTAAGYTKKLTRTMMFMFAYSIANFISPQLWQPQYAPRYYVSWAIMLALSYTSCPVCLLIIRFILIRRNKARLQALAEEEDDDSEYGYIDVTDENGELVRQKVDASMLDLTDFENKRFIYPL
ncbi:hypothetical protein OGAPHI_001356 [Ogataea philodendri]|uniref:Allantoate permease n=1 Tax=Ogataea philodendri TaxID=1378263 RepID=A0A9P8PCT8_9ASCO|nr:uncharacterized protein OGAPHI_001356 [Ogataea philodendri]KAH3669235.1 hypothetical protein OGAPHI_001356 [Ogataea philodendri]